MLVRTKADTDSQVTVTKVTTITPILREEDINLDIMVTVMKTITITIITIRKEEAAEIVALVWVQYVAYAACLIVVFDRPIISNHHYLAFDFNKS